MGILKAPLDLWSFEITTSQDMPKLRAEDEKEKKRRSDREKREEGAWLS